jgi:hypothetical protein
MSPSSAKETGNCINVLVEQAHELIDPFKGVYYNLPTNERPLASAHPKDRFVKSDPFPI